MKKHPINLMLSCALGALGLHIALQALVPPPPNQFSIEQQIRNANNTFKPLMRDLEFCATDLNNIQKALEQTKNPIQRLSQNLDVLQKDRAKFMQSVALSRQKLADAQRVIKELRDKSLNIVSQARQRAAEAQRLARSTDEIQRSTDLAKKLEEIINKGEALLTAMQNQLNKIEVISTTFPK